MTHRHLITATVPLVLLATVMSGLPDIVGQTLASALINLIP